MHAIIVGTTGSGKSTLAKLLCKTLRKKKKKCAVLTPTAETGWEADFKTTDGKAFLDYVKANEELFCFVDESGDAIGKYDDEMNWLATGSRHKGHSVFFCVQSAQQISTAIRNCCSQAYIFACTKAVLKILGEDFNEKALLKYDGKIPQFHFIVMSRFEEMKMGRLDKGGKALYIGKIGEFSTQTEPEHDEQVDIDGGDSDSGNDGVN